MPSRKALAVYMAILLTWLATLWVSVFIWNARDQYPAFSSALFVIGCFSTVSLLMLFILKRINLK